MPFAASYTVSQSADGLSITITDTSNYAGYGGKAAFTGRQLYLYLNNGSQLTFPNAPDFSFANYPSDTITISVNRDYAPLILLSVTQIAGAVVFNSQNLYVFTAYTQNFLYGLVQYIAANPSVLSDTNFYSNLNIVQTEKDNSLQAGVYNDQYSAQSALDRAYNYIVNQSFYF